MTRSAKLLLTIALAAVAIPASARAQSKEPKDNKWTKEATKLLTVAALKKIPEDQQALNQQALGVLQEGLQKDSGNAKVWLLTGQAYASLGQYAKADSILKKTLQLRPEYADEVTAVRQRAWADEFKKGTDALDQNQLDSARVHLEAAEVIYPERPESVLNLGVVYLNAGQWEKATEALLTAKARINGPLLAKITPEEQQTWKGWEQLIDGLRAQVQSNKGITAFGESDYTAAAAAFKLAGEIDPYSRDYAYNLAESYFAGTTKLERERTQAEAQKPPATADIKALDTTLAPIYTALIDAAQRLLTFEPMSSDPYIMMAKAYRGQSLAVTDLAAQKTLTDHALAALNSAQALPFEVVDISSNVGDTTTVTAKVKNHALKAGDPAKLHFTFYAIDGTVLNTADVSVPVAAPDSTVPFEVKAETKGHVGGWKYEVAQ